MPIVIVGMLDERQEGLRLIKETIEARGHRSKLVDISIGTGAIKSDLKANVSCAEVASAGGSTIDAVRSMLAKEREKATGIMAEGLGRTLHALFDSGEMEGVIAVGGMTGTFLSLSAMKGLPFGLPKLMISSVAAMPAYAKPLSEYFGVRDITVMHTVVDTVGSNPLVATLMVNGAGAVCGMVEAARTINRRVTRPSIALTEFGFCDKGAHFVRELLEDKYNLISFHATGLGEKAACDLVGQGLFEAFIDLVPGGFSEQLLGGNRAAGLDRLDAGVKMGKPYILSPCGFDMISCGPIQRKDQGDPLWVNRKLAERKFLVQDAMRVQARTTPEEMKTIARETAERLNRHPNKKMVKFIIPVKGFSSISVEGGALHDPDSDRAFVREIRAALDPEIAVIQVENHINSPEFARAVVDALRSLLPLEEKTAEEGVRDASRLNGKKVLVVDDEADILEVIKELLPMCRVVCASTAQEAREMLATQDFDLAVLDIMGVDGYGLLGITTYRKIPAVMLTAHAFTPPHLVRSIREGAAAYIPKEEIEKIADFLNDVLLTKETGKNSWQAWQDRLPTSFFEKRWGSAWRDADKGFWDKFGKSLKSKE